MPDDLYKKLQKRMDICKKDSWICMKIYPCEPSIGQDFLGNKLIEKWKAYLFVRIKTLGNPTVSLLYFTDPKLGPK